MYLALTLVVLVGICAYALDLSFLYTRRAQAQRAADAAALAGAFQLANFKGQAYADTMANYYAARDENGDYENGKKDTTVTTTFPATDENGTVKYNWYRVTIRRKEPLFFAPIFGFKNATVGVSATALYTTLAPISINGLGSYGVEGGDTNLSLFGPNGLYQNGDCYSVKKLNDQTTANPYYNAIDDALANNSTAIRTAGYNFMLNVPEGMGQTKVEIFDPDCYNTPPTSNGGSGNVADAQKGYRIDEYRGANGSASTLTTDRTTTVYSLYWDNQTPANPYDDVFIATKSAGGTTSTDISYDMKWNNFFSFNRASYVGGNFRINVKSTAGASENGFDLRAGPANATTWNKNNGTSITADGHLPMNFNTAGTVTVNLGTVPVQAANSQLIITKFDTDVGSKSVTYQCSTLPGMSWSGTLSGQGTFATDQIQVPSNYTTAGNWTATYAAGSGDTSVWDMSYTGYGPGSPGSVKLIR